MLKISKAGDVISPTTSVYSNEEDRLTASCASYSAIMLAKQDTQSMNICAAAMPSASYIAALIQAQRSSSAADSISEDCSAAVPVSRGGFPTSSQFELWQARFRKLG